MENPQPMLDRLRQQLTVTVSDLLDLGVKRVVVVAPPWKKVLDDAPDPSLWLGVSKPAADGKCRAILNSQMCEIVQPVREVLQDVAQQFGIDFVDAAPCVSSVPGMMYDGAHVTLSGSKEVAKVVGCALAELLQRDESADARSLEGTVVGR